ncbi:MAG: phosphoribosylformylglycinamidine cyclo-ligase [candidate division Zixibacteria bacterium]|nr:phosphoribosylformylglycinamidine cyclo-ligase [candidate division Zixibacteria bacterium]
MPKMDYRAAGVNLDTADEAVSRIAEMARTTYTPGVLAGVGPFSGLFQLDVSKYKEPVLVSSCDGVGTKLKLAIRWGHHRTIGADLVNHCVNDILTCGAEPLAFLDYLAVARMDADQVSDVMAGVAEACRENTIALIGGETAEMPGLYKLGDYDLAGFITGMVEKSAILDGQAIESGNMLVGLASTGPHTNGYSLVRRILFDQDSYDLEDRPEALEGATVGEAVMAVHRSYRSVVDAMRGEIDIRGMAHITGGGVEGNLERILPDNCQAAVDTSNWPVLPVFRFLQHVGGVESAEMYRVFNMGIGYIIVVDNEQVKRTIEISENAGVPAYQIGHISPGPRGVIVSTPS